MQEMDEREPREHYDVAIIGAGPAGANLARLIGGSGARVLLIDGSRGQGKVCGGLLSPDAQDILARYDISLPKEVLVSPQLFSVRTVDLESGLTRYYRRSYMNVDRQRFDDFLLELVPKTVEVTPSRCESIVPSEKGYTLALAGEGARLVSCDLLVGADGASSIVRRTLFPEQRAPRYVAIQQWFPAAQTDPYYSCLFDNETSSGCSWIFFKDGMLIFGGAFDIPHGRAAFEAQKQKLAARGMVDPSILASPVRTEACTVLRPKLTCGIFRGRGSAFLIGEAAGLISPSSFEGISYALASAEALADALRHGGSPAQIGSAYRRGTRGLVAKIGLRCLKRPFLYSQTLRTAVMKSGITAIKIKKGETS